MPSSDLPERSSLEYLRKLAKDRLREHGFSSWRALKAEVDRRRSPIHAAFLAACAGGELGTLRDLVQRDRGLVGQRDRDGATGLHLVS
jgi:ankyrin repeat protein